MPKFARPNSYTSKQSNQSWTGATRAANSVEASAGISEQLYISPATLADAVVSVVPLATNTVAGIVKVTAAPYETGVVATKGYVDSLIQTASVTLTSVEVLALATTPIELVAAPATGSYLEFISAQFILDYNSIGYTESGDNLGIKYTNASGVQVSSSVECTGFIDQTADTITNAVPAQDVIVAASAADNAPLVLDNLGSNFAAGNSPLTVKVFYRVIESGL